eukprot:462318_1
MDDLKCIDIKNDLNDFVKIGLKLSGILASRAKKAIGNLQKQSCIAKSVVIVISEEEANAIDDIYNKCNNVKTYLNTLNTNIEKLQINSMENETQINSMENETQINSMEN